MTGDRMIRTNADFYAAVEAISEEIDSHRAGGGKPLRDSLSASTVAGEVLGEARLQLRELRRASETLPDTTVKRIDDALRFVDGLLGPW